MNRKIRVEKYRNPIGDNLRAIYIHVYYDGEAKQVYDKLIKDIRIKQRYKEKNK